MSLNRQNQLPNPRFRDDDDDVFLSKSGLDPYALVPNRHRANTVPEEGLATLSPADVTVHLSDDGDFFSVKAEVPGVRRENLDVSIGDDGRSLTIRGGAAVSGSASGGSEVQEAEGGATSPGVGRGTSSTTEYTETAQLKAGGNPPNSAGLPGPRSPAPSGYPEPSILKASKRRSITEF
ncbi:hypothetical protein FRB90_003548 [Tulasnella sp. 427]|nr:hypothetical protein FRB90_003548 [Tulasnella sp. 427]